MNLFDVLVFNLNKILTVTVKIYKTLLNNIESKLSLIGSIRNGTTTFTSLNHCLLDTLLAFNTLF